MAIIKGDGSITVTGQDVGQQSKGAQIIKSGSTPTSGTVVIEETTGVYGSVNTGGGSSGRQISSSTTRRVATQQEFRAEEAARQTAYGAKPPNEIRLTSTPLAQPANMAAYNAAQSAAGELNRQMGGQQYFIVSQGPGGYFITQNPNINAQPGLQAELERRLADAPGIAVEKQNGKLFIRSAIATDTPANGDLVSPGQAGTLTPIRIQSKVEELSTEVFDFTTSPAPVRTQSEVEQLTIEAMAKKGFIPLASNESEELVFTRPASAGLAIPTNTTQTPGGTAELGPTLPGAKSEQTSPFVQTPLQYLYSIKPGESIRKSAFEGIKTIAGEGAAQAADVPFGVAGYAIDVGYETAKTGFTVPVLGKAASEAGAFTIREKIADVTGIEQIGGIQVRPTQEQRNVAISDLAAVLPYTPSVPVFATFATEAAISSSAAPGPLTGQTKTIGAVRVKAGGAQFETVLGAPTKYDVEQLASGQATNVGAYRFAVGESSRGIVPVDALGNVGAGVGKSSPFTIELIKGTVRGTVDPFRLSVMEAIQSGAVLAGFETGVELLSGQPLQPRRIAEAGAAGALVIYPAGKYLPLASMQERIAAPGQRPDVVPGQYEVVGKKSIPGGAPDNQLMLPGPGAEVLDITPRYYGPFTPQTQPPAPVARRVNVEPGDYIIVGQPSGKGTQQVMQKQVIRKYSPRTELIEVTRETQLVPSGETRSVVVETETPLAFLGQKQRPLSPEKAFREGLKQKPVFDVSRFTDIIKPVVKPTAAWVSPEIIPGEQVQIPIQTTTPGQTQIQPPVQGFTESFTETGITGTSAPVKTPEGPSKATEINVKFPTQVLGFPLLPFIPGGGTGGEKATGRRVTIPAQIPSLLEAELSGPPVIKTPKARSGKKVTGRSLLGI